MVVCTYTRKSEIKVEVNYKAHMDEIRAWSPVLFTLNYEIDKAVSENINNNNNNTNDSRTSVREYTMLHIYSHRSRESDLTEILTQSEELHDKNNLNIPSSSSSKLSIKFKNQYAFY